MPNLLLSGPAGAGKTGAANDVLRDSNTPAIALDFQRLYAALLLIDRVGGRYPERLASNAFALPLAEYLRAAGITAATNQQVDLVVTNSDGDAARRATLLSRLGPGATERILDPGLSVVRDRLSVSGVLSHQCGQAIDRWYGRL